MTNTKTIEIKLDEKEAEVLKKLLIAKCKTYELWLSNVPYKDPKRHEVEQKIDIYECILQRLGMDLSVLDEIVLAEKFIKNLAKKEVI
ncbi:MAG TPA: hypothetical protein DHV22_13070 [Xanthomarina gelatinilytica]|uniref:Uncharacterized protein n=1 Tax=Xanthomarina gelatinilytica TaxID=1137281 RepID=A0A3D6BWN4_9FLAO|nr:hypothetical protein [Xanthomarina gelatinilytica]